MIQAKLQDMVAKFQTMHIMNCFEQWHDKWACCTKSQGDYFEGAYTMLLQWRNKHSTETQKKTFFATKQFPSVQLFFHTGRS